MAWGDCHGGSFGQGGKAYLTPGNVRYFATLSRSRDKVVRAYPVP